MTSFTVELLSTGLSTIDKENTINSFTNTLPEEVQLDGSWEVALVSISYPTTAINVTDGRYKMGDNFRRSVSAGVPQGSYRSVEAIVNAINKFLREIDNDEEGEDAITNFHLDCATGAVSFEMVSILKSIEFLTEDLATIFGVDVGERHVDKFTSGYPTNIAYNHTMFIYCDIIENQSVGGQKVPLLRAVPMKMRLRKEEIVCNAQMEYAEFAHLLFVPVTKHHFHSISIQVCNHAGKLIPYLDIGLIRMTLLFRKFNL